MIYELTVLTPETASELDIEQVERVIRRYGEIGKREDEGIKRLAYPINGHDKARYLYYEINMPQGKPQELSSVLNTNDMVLRYLLVMADTRVYNQRKN